MIDFKKYVYLRTLEVRRAFSLCNIITNYIIMFYKYYIYILLCNIKYMIHNMMCIQNLIYKLIIKNNNNIIT